MKMISLSSLFYGLSIHEIRFTSEPPGGGIGLRVGPLAPMRKLAKDQ